MPVPIRGLTELTTELRRTPGLKTPAIRFWSAWSGETVAGMGALHRIDADTVRERRIHDLRAL
jgi:hypothetical protein